MKDRAAVQKNLSCSDLFDYTKEMQMRKRQTEVMDDIMKVKDKLGEVEEKLKEECHSNNEKIRRQYQLLKRKLAVLEEEDAKLSAAIKNLSPVHGDTRI